LGTLDAKLWLEGTDTVSLVMLVKLEEDPCYKCSIKDLTDYQFAVLKFPTVNETKEPFVFNSPYRPVRYKGFL